MPRRAKKTDENDEIAAGLTVSGEKLADFLGMQPLTVSQYATQGYFVRAGRNLYHLRDCVRKFVDDQRKLTRGMSHRNAANAIPAEGVALTAKQRIEEAKAAALEMDLAEKRGEMVPVDQANQLISELAATTKQRLLGIPAKIAPLLVGSDDLNGIASTIEDAVLEALSEISERATLIDEDEGGSDAAAA